MSQDSHYEHEYLKTRLASWVFPCLVQYFNWHNSRRTRSFLEGFCPRGRMSCLGRYRRNLLTYTETSNIVLYLALLNLTESGSMMLFSGSIPLQPEAVFLCYNSIWFLGFGLIIGVLLPHSIEPMLLPNHGTTLARRQKTGFYSSRRSKVLEPRRPPDVSLKTQQAGWLKKHKKKQHRRFVVSLPPIEEIPRTLIT